MSTNNVCKGKNQKKNPETHKKQSCKKAKTSEIKFCNFKYYLLNKKKPLHMAVFQPSNVMVVIISTVSAFLYNNKIR